MLGQNFSTPKLKKGSGSTMLGIDIGSYSIKVVEFSPTGTGHEIKGLAKKELPPEMRKAERDPKAVAELVKECLAEGGISCQGCSCDGIRASGLYKAHYHASNAAGGS